MRRPSFLLSLSLPLCSTLLATACDDGRGSTSGFADRQVIIDYADQVVIPTYALLAERTVALDAALATLAQAPTTGSLAGARAAWIAMRVPWEQSETFLFGPVSAQGWDPAMDSWPLNRTDLDAVLGSADALTQAYIRNLPETQKGFHTIEYLLWGTASNKQPGAFTARELEYLGGLSDELVLITRDLAASWTTGFDGLPAYREVLVTAGEGSTAYPSLGAAAQELLGGMSAICDEVANGKIADPYDARDPNLVESQFSFNSIVDFQDNLRGVGNVYLGGVTLAGTAGRGLTVHVASLDPALDARVRSELETAVAAIGAIPAPFRTAIQEPANDATIEAAQAAIRTLQATIDGDLSTLVLGP
ncbi:MAG: peptidase M75 [Myxococcota bacterium]|nr:peptidase M75 [Myxococcota bacterium]